MTKTSEDVKSILTRSYGGVTNGNPKRLISRQRETRSPSKREMGKHAQRIKNMEAPRLEGAASKKSGLKVVSSSNAQQTLTSKRKPEVSRSIGEKSYSHHTVYNMIKSGCRVYLDISEKLEREWFEKNLTSLGVKIVKFLENGVGLIVTSQSTEKPKKSLKPDILPANPNGEFMASWANASTVTSTTTENIFPSRSKTSREIFGSTSTLLSSAERLNAIVVNPTKLKGYLIHHFKCPASLTTENYQLQKSTNNLNDSRLLRHNTGLKSSSKLPYHEFEFPYVQFTHHRHEKRPVQKEFCPETQNSSTSTKSQQDDPGKVRLPFILWSTENNACPFYHPSFNINVSKESASKGSSGRRQSKSHLMNGRSILPSMKTGSSVEYNLRNILISKCMEFRYNAELAPESRIKSLNKCLESGKKLMKASVSKRQKHFPVFKHNSLRDILIEAFQTDNTSTERPRKKFKAVKKPGYCESCLVKYSDYETHAEGTQHTQFKANLDNFFELDNLLNRLKRPKKVDELNFKSVNRRNFIAFEENSAGEIVVMNSKKPAWESKEETDSRHEYAASGEDDDARIDINDHNPLEELIYSGPSENSEIIENVRETN